jgi:hypothetical protein
VAGTRLQPAPMWMGDFLDAHAVIVDPSDCQRLAAPEQNHAIISVASKSFRRSRRRFRSVPAKFKAHPPLYIYEIDSFDSKQKNER